MRRKPYYATRHELQNPGEALYGWAEIAEYMGASAGVVQRWYKRFGMPVVRHLGKRVFTTRNAIDDWVKSISMMERRIEVTMKNSGQNGEAE